MFLTHAKAEGDKPKEFAPEKDLVVTGARLGKKEKASGREAQQVEYAVSVRGVKGPLTATVWVDVKTNLPLKRALTLDAGKERVTVTETYTNLTLDGKIADKEFALPE